METTNANVQTPTAPAPAVTHGNGNGNNQSHQPTPGRENTQFIRPRAHIVENGDAFILQVELPGVRREGLEVTSENGELSIVGRRAPFQTEAELIHRESRPADFRRVFEIDPSIDAAKIAARLEQGVLTLNLPKAEAARPRRIEVQHTLS